MALLSQNRLRVGDAQANFHDPRCLHIRYAVGTRQPFPVRIISVTMKRISHTTSQDSVEASHDERRSWSILTMLEEKFLKRFPSNAWLVY